MRNLVLLSIVLITIILVILSFKSFNTDTDNGHRNPEPDKGLIFIEPDWQKALVEAQKQDKLIFLDAYASWCGPCKLLKKNTFPDKGAGDYFNKHFINVAIDMEKGDGPALAKKFHVSAYPTLIITDAEGNLVSYTQGYIKPKQLIEFGKDGLTRINKQ
jgi:thioredoxin-related protein